MDLNTVFVFSGEGVHCPDSDISVLKTSPSWLAVLDAIADLGYEDAEDFLQSNLGNHSAPNSVVVTTAINILNADLWCYWGKLPSIVVGHSAGEIAAACVCGMLSIKEAIREAHSLGESVACAAGNMIHTLLPRRRIAQFPAEGLHVAAVNYVVQLGEAREEDIISVTLCGPSSCVDSYLVGDRAATKLKPEHPWHHPNLLLPEASSRRQATKCRFVSAVTGTELFEIGADHWQLWLRQPVEFARALQVVAVAPSVVIEMGAHPVMADAIQAAFGKFLVASACSMRRHEPSRLVLSQRSVLPGFSTGLQAALEGFTFDVPTQGVLEVAYMKTFADQGFLSQHLIALSEALASFFPGVEVGDLYRFSSLHSLVCERDLALNSESASTMMHGTREAISCRAQEEAPYSQHEDIEHTVLATIASILAKKVGDLPIDASFASLGITSMLAVDLSARLGRVFGLHLPATLVFEVVDIRQLCASLRERLGSLHDKLSHYAAARPVKIQMEHQAEAENQPVVVQGVACALPGGCGGTLVDWSQFWQMLLSARDCVVERDLNRPVIAQNENDGPLYSHTCSQGGFVDNKTLTLFDAKGFGINPAEAEIMDPQQRLSLQVAREALEDSGAALGANAAIGVFVGVTYVDFASLVKLECSGRNPSAYSGTGLTNAVCANRISYTFDLRGPSISCDTACSSSIVTSDLATSELHRGRCNNALSIGVNVQMDPFWTSAFASAGMLSPRGRCRFGDNAADGYVRGEGCAGLVLQSHSAEIYAASPYADILNTCVNQDGRSNGLTAPNPSSQVALLQHAHFLHAQTATNVIEAHGTGTLLGDPIEITSMSKALRADFDQASVLQTGSLKTNIGHLECAAGAASTLKLALLLRAHVVPASLHFEVANRHIDWDTCKVGVVTEMMDMPSTELLIGGVSGFGFGGTNGHIVLRSRTKKAQIGIADKEGAPQAVVFSDTTKVALLESIKRVHKWIDCPQIDSLQGGISDIATAAAGRVPGVVAASQHARAAVVASSLSDLRNKLSELMGRMSSITTSRAPSFSTPRIALVMMGSEMKRTTELFEHVKASVVNSDMFKSLHEKLKYGYQDPDVAALVSLHVASTMLRSDFGVTFDAIIGHGVAGELAALTLADLLSCSDASSLLATGQYVHAASSLMPKVMVLSSYTAAPVQVLPPADYWTPAACESRRSDGYSRLVDAIAAARCDLIVELSLGGASLLELLTNQDSTQESSKAVYPRQEIITMSLGCAEAPSKSPNFLNETILSAAASIFEKGGQVNLSGFAASSSMARLPPRGSEPVLCWPRSSPESVSEQQLKAACTNMQSCAGEEQVLSGRPSSASTESTNCTSRRCVEGRADEGIKLLQHQVDTLRAELAAKESIIQKFQKQVCESCKPVIICPTSPLQTSDTYDDPFPVCETADFGKIVLDSLSFVLPDVHPSEIDIDADLVEDGLDSLSAMELSRRIFLASDVTLSATQLLLVPTVRGITQKLHECVANMKSGRAVCADDKDVSSSLEVDGILTSGLQQGMFFQQLSDQSSQVFLETFSMEVVGPLDLSRFRASWRRVLTLMPQLRAYFDVGSNGMPMQHVASDDTINEDDFIEVHEKWQSSCKDVKEFIQCDRERGLRSDSAPLLRISILLIGENVSVVVVTVNHLIIDGWSWQVIMRLLEKEYADESERRNLGIRNVATFPSFQTVVDYEMRMDSTSARQYWCRLLEDAPLTLGKQVCMQADLRGSDITRQEFKLDSEQVLALHKLASRCACTLPAVLHTGWLLVYSSSRLCCQNDVVVGYTSSRRTMPVIDIEHVIGPVVNTLPLRICMNDSSMVVQVIQDVHQRILANGEHEWLPFTSIQEAVGHRLPLDVIVDVQHTEGYSCKFGPHAMMQYRELIDSVGTAITIRFLLEHDGSLTCRVVCETSEIARDGLDLLVAGLRNILLRMLNSEVGYCSVASLRNSVESSMGVVKSIAAKKITLGVPELPAFGVSSACELVHFHGNVHGNELSKEAAFTAFAAALDQWSNGPSTFAIWSCLDASHKYEWAKAQVDRTAALSANMREPVMDCIASLGSTPAAAFSYGCEPGFHQVGRHETMLFCFHAAGSGGNQFATLTAECHDLANLEFRLVELPGHGSRRSELSQSDMDLIVDLVISEHGSTMERAGDYIFLGISYGALVAYEVACAMARKGKPPLQLIVASQAAPTTVATGIDLSVDDASLVKALETHGWLARDIVEAGPQAWEEILPTMRSDLTCEQTYMTRKRASSLHQCLLSMEVVVLVGSEDLSLMRDTESLLAPWRSLTAGLCTQYVVPHAGHGFIDTAAGRSAVRNTLLLNRAGFRPIAVHALVESTKWTIVGDSGLLPRLVLDGIAETFAKVLHGIMHDIEVILRELIPSHWCATPWSEPAELDEHLLQDGFKKNESSEAQTAIVEVGDEGDRYQLSYKQVEEMSSNLGAQLVLIGVRRLDRVALICSKGWPQLIGSVGILQCGAAYLPIDPRQVPKERAVTLLKLSDAKALVTDSQTWDNTDWIFESGLPVVVADCIPKVPKSMISKLQDIRSACLPDSSAYVLYTSGSTGVPKGVDCHHRGAVNTCRDLIRRFNIGSGDKVLALSSFSFDLSVFDLFGTAMAGGSVVLPQSHLVTPPDPSAWMKIIVDEGVTLINAVPAFLELIVGHCEMKGLLLPPSLRLVWMSGDWIPVGLPNRIRALAEGVVTIVAMGGATEAAIWSNMYVVPEQLPSGWKSVPYGRPLGNQSMYVLCENTRCLEHCAPWVIGMIYIGGVGVATGYLGDNDRTSISFIVHPVSGERLYRTGDLGRLRNDDHGQLLIEILGREDSQVKLNGFRIELGEIESVALTCDGIEECCASICSTGTGEVLVVFFRGASVHIETLRRYLSESLPSQLVPKSLIRVDCRFPLNSNGKVDRKSLAELHADVISSANSHSARISPVGNVELLLCRAIAEVLPLRMEDVCVETNLFSIGLNSLGCMRLTAAVLHHGFECSISDVFTYPTVRSLAKHIPEVGSNQCLPLGIATPIFQINEACNESCEPFPLIGITKAYWTGLRKNPYCPRGCRPQIAFEFEWDDGARIDVQRLEQCFDHLISRNAVFRATVMPDTPSMRYLCRDEVSPIKFRVREVSEKENVQACCDEEYHAIFDEAIDPFTFPLLKGTVLHLPNGLGSRFFYCVSLFIMDGITDLTWRLHISKLYRGDKLPEVPALTYKAYIDGYLNEDTGIYTSAKWKAARDYWMSKIDAGLPLPPQVPLLKESHSNLGSFCDKGTTTIGAKQLTALKALAAQHCVTPTAVLLMLYCVALGRHSASGHMLINVLHCLRHPVHEDHEKVLGNFSSSFLCPIDVSASGGRRSLLELARVVMNSLMECQMNNAISGVDVMSLINSKHSALGKAAAPYVFVSALGLEDTLSEWKSLCFREARVVESTSGTYMVHAVKEYPDGSMLSSFNVLDDAFGSDVSDAIARDQLRLLQAITMDSAWDLCPDEILGTLPVPPSLGPAPTPDASDMLHSPLLHHAHCTPDAIAVVDTDQSATLSYLSLLKAATFVRNSLVDCGALHGTARYGAPLVAVVCLKSWQQIVAVLGVLLAGCAYLPINVAAWPRGRIQVVLEVGEVVAVVSCGATLRSLDWLTDLLRPVINVDARSLDADSPCQAPRMPLSKSSDVLAYCIFTSGSTGKPKGVAMAHKAALNTIKALIDMHDLDDKTVTLGLSHLSFDLSVSDIFLTLRTGGTLVIPPESTLSPPSPHKWWSICADYGVNLWNSVPALFGLFCEATQHMGKNIPPSLEVVWLSGDFIPESLPLSARMLSKQALRIYAMGGATEAGIWSNSADISQHSPSDGLVPYGNALPGQEMYVVREDDFAIAPVGVHGMLVISGSSLMMGYYNDTSTTSNALVDVCGERLYLTRDAGYVRRRSDGHLECMITGRIHDDVLGYVKVRGFRVELQEVEAAIRSHVDIKAALVNLFEGDLVAYVVLHDARNGSDKFTLEQELRHAMKNLLPVYAVPKWIEVLDAFPLSSNGKIDRACLPSPTRVIDDAREDADDAASELEHSVIVAASKVGIQVSSRLDDIFAQGADSVATLRLIFKLEEQHGIRIDIGKIFGDGRISSIANCLQATAVNMEGASFDARLSLSKLAESSTLDSECSRISCFLCHGAGTTALALSSLAVEFAKLTTNATFYGISDSFLSSAGAEFAFSSIEEVASSMADLVAAAVSADKSKPEVWLGGWSYGGVVAFACARELATRGVHVKQLIMVDAPLGQNGGAELDDETRRQLSASSSPELVGRIAQHFEACNHLLGKYQFTGSRLPTSVLDVRPQTSNIDYLSDTQRSLAADAWQRISIDDASHITLVQPPFAEQVARHCLSCTTISGN